VENAVNHFMSFNTICDATQVSIFRFDYSVSGRDVFNLPGSKGSWTESIDQYMGEKNQQC
jgi:hypothetical protein